MKKEFSKMSVIDALQYLEEMDYEASVLNKNTEDLLTKAKLSNKINKDMFNLLYNTLQSMKKGEITINGQVVQPYEKTEVASSSIQFAVPIEQAISVKSSKELGMWLDNLEDWEISRVSDIGTEFISTSNNGDRFVFNFKKREITIDDYNYKLVSDFTHILNVPEQGIYLFKKEGNEMNGVSWIRWTK